MTYDVLRIGEEPAGHCPLAPPASFQTHARRVECGVRLNARRGTNARRAAVVPALLLWLSLGVGMRAAEIAVPNASFESPSTNFVSVIIDDWLKPPKPDWYDEGGGFQWEQLTGLFRNPDPSDPRHIDNCDGDQAVWLFAVPEVGLFQELGDTTMPSAEDVVYEVGNSYELTVGVIGGKGAMFQGVTLELALYYRDDASHQVAVEATTIPNTTNVFHSLTHFVDFQVRVPTVEARDAWAGRPIGVRFLSTVDPARQGGYWDLDNVRLAAYAQPMLVEVGTADGEIQFTLVSEPGLPFELLASPDPGVSLAEWERVTILTNVTGRATYSEPATNSGGRFYQARQLE